MILARDEPAVHPAELRVPAGGGPGEDERERMETDIELEEEGEGSSSGTNNTSIRALPSTLSSSLPTRAHHQLETIPLPEDETEIEDEGASSSTMPSVQQQQQQTWCNNFCLITDIRCFPRAVSVK